MKVNVDIKKGVAAMSGALQKTSETGKKVAANVAENVKKGAKDISEKQKNDSYQKRLKKYNPLFPEQYGDDNFNLPNMIVIVDDAVRKGIDVCEGAIGWLSNEKGMEVLHLYDEFIPRCGIQFVPNAVCDSIYYIDRFDRKRFVQTDFIFSKAHEERLAELEHIAYSLGAKKCSIEICETSTEVEVRKKKIEIGESITGSKISSNEKMEQSSSYKGSSERKGTINVEFEGSDEVKQPDLKWFAYDDNIKNLINMRMENKNAIKTKTLTLEGRAFATMSQKTAYAIDNAISRICLNGKTNMEGQATKENSSKLIFVIEF